MTRPLFLLDPGWLFVSAGLVMLVAIIALPPERQLRGMTESLSSLQAEERLAIQRLRAYSDFLEHLDRGDPVLTRRLAAAQLNLRPAHEIPVLAAPSASDPVTEWIESTIHREEVSLRPFPDSSLARLALGPSRHWVIAGSMACLFMGLLLMPGSASRGSRPDPGTDEQAEVLKPHAV